MRNLQRRWLISCVALAMAAPALAQGSLTLADTQPAGPGPGDTMVVAERGGVRFVVSLALDGNQALTHRLDGSRLTPVGRTPTGDGPRALALARRGDLAVVANSRSHDLSVMEIGPDGLLREARRVASGGQSPWDVAVAWDDLVLVANRDSDQLTLFHLDRGGELRLLAQERTGVAPHAVAVSAHGLVAVANSGSNDLSLFQLSRGGDLVPLETARPVGGFPVALAFDSHGRSLFVAQRSAQPGVVDDQVLGFRVGRGGALEPAGSTPCGRFLTDIEVASDRLFAVTMTPLGEDQVRAYRRDGEALALDAALTTPGSPPPSFKQLASAPPGKGERTLDRHLFVSEYQAGWLRSIDYRR